MEIALLLVLVERLLLVEKVSNNLGYTLLESLVVLSIVSIMSFVLIANLVPIHQAKIIETFFDQFEKDMMYAQQYALLNEETIYILFRGNRYQYTIEQSNLAGSLIVRNYHQGIKIEGGTMKNRVTFRANGAIQTSGSLLITYNNRTYKVTFYLGKGRLNIEEL